MPVFSSLQLPVSTAHPDSFGRGWERRKENEQRRPASGTPPSRVWVTADGWLWAVVGNRQPPSPGSPEWSAPTRNSWLEHAVPHFVQGKCPVKTWLWRDKTPADSLLYNAAIALPICGNEQKWFNKESNWFLGEVRGKESPRSRCEQTAITLEEEEHASVGVSNAEAKRRVPRPEDDRCPRPCAPARAEGTTEATGWQCVALPADRQQEDESRRAICGHALRG